MSDLEIARQIAEGDSDAAERFVRTHYPFVFRLMRHLTRSREDAEDLTQQAFVTVREKIAYYRGGASLKTWLHRVAFNEYAQWKRNRRHTVPLMTDHGSDEPGFGACIVGESLLSALAALPDKLRETFILHEVDELPVADVAQVLRVPAGTVKARLFYARKRLRVSLQDGAEAHSNEPQEAIL